MQPSHVVTLDTTSCFIIKRQAGVQQADHYEQKQHNSGPIIVHAFFPGQPTHSRAHEVGYRTQRMHIHQVGKHKQGRSKRLTASWHNTTARDQNEAAAGEAAEH